MRTFLLRLSICLFACAHPLTAAGAEAGPRNTVSDSDAAGKAAIAPPRLFSAPRPGFTPSPALQSMMQSIASEPSTLSVNLVHVHLEALKSPAVSLRISNQSFIAWRTITGSLGNEEGAPWHGSLAKTEDMVSIDVIDGEFHGTIKTEHFHFQVEPLGEGIHAVIEVSRTPSSEHPPEFPSGAQSERHPPSAPRQSHTPPEAERKSLTQAASPLSPIAGEDLHFSPAVAQTLSDIKARASTKHVTLRRFEKGRITPATKTLMLNLTDRFSFPAFRTEVVGPDESDGSYRWLGLCVPEAPSEILLVVNGRNCTATMQHGRSRFELRPAGSNMHALIQVSPEKSPPEHPPDYPAGALKRVQ